MILIDLLEILGCALATYAIVITLFEKGGNHKHEIHLR